MPNFFGLGNPHFSPGSYGHTVIPACSCGLDNEFANLTLCSNKSVEHNFLESCPDYFFNIHFMLDEQLPLVTQHSHGQLSMQVDDLPRK